MHNNVLYAEKLRNSRNMQKYALLTFDIEKKKKKDFKLIFGKFFFSFYY